MRDNIISSEALIGPKHCIAGRMTAKTGSLGTWDFAQPVPF